MKISFTQVNNFVELLDIYQLIAPLSMYYPKFNHWYYDKVIPGVLMYKDVVIAAKLNQNLVGISIIKNTEYEKKLRCIRLSDEYQGKGFGLHLIDESLRVLNCDKPICSVSEEMLHSYSRIFVERYGFNLTNVEKGLYRKGKLEYIFNDTSKSFKKESIYY